MEQSYNLKRLDNKIAIGSGVFTGALDILMVPELSFADANTWGTDRIQAFALSVAQNEGYTGDDISGAIKHLRDEKTDAMSMFARAFSFDSNEDDVEGDTDEEETKNEIVPIENAETYEEASVVMLADQLGIEGLIFSIVTYVTGKTIGVDSEGKLVLGKLDGFEKKGFEEGIYWGTLRWLFNLAYSVLGEGVDRINDCLDPDIPKEIKEILIKLTDFPGLKNKAKKLLEIEDAFQNKETLFEKLSELIYSSIEKGNEGKPNFGMILGVVHEMVNKKQYVPVVLNEVIVSAFYTFSRLLMKISMIDISSLESVENISFSDCLPILNEELQSMRKLASTTFMSINVVKSGIKAAVKCNNNPKEFGVHLLQNINYFGAVDCVANFAPDYGTGLEFLYNEFKQMADEQKEFFKDVLHNINEAVGVAGKIRETAKTVANLASPVTYVKSVKDVYDALRDAHAELALAREQRLLIEAECAEHIRQLQEYETELQQAISEYFVRKYSVFDKAFDTIDKALLEGNVDDFICGQNLIQRELSGKVLFETMEEFDDLMNSDENIVF